MLLIDDDEALLPHPDWETRPRGTNEDEYDIYAANAMMLGWPVKTFDEWLNS